MPDASYIFSRAIATASACAYQNNYSYLTQKICESIAGGFLNEQSLGDQIYINMQSNPSFWQTDGVSPNSTFYNIVQQNFRNLLNLNYPSLNNFEVDIYSLLANSIIYGYYISPSIALTGVQNYINNTFKYADNLITQVSPFYQGYIFIPPFSTEFIQNAVNTYPYKTVFTEIQASVKDSNLPLVNINYYNVTGLFSSPNLNLMKDAENQYYAISGSLIYNNLLTGLPNCNHTQIQILTSTGNKNIDYISNIPCQEQNSSIGPVSGIVFYREFNDGPYSSGNFTPEIVSGFMEFDQNVLIPNDYSSNAKILNSFYVDTGNNIIPLLSNSGVTFIDANGEIDLNQEYLYVPQTECGLQLMRIGGNNPRCLVTGQNGIFALYGTIPATGFKFVNLQLDTDWNNNLSNCLTNPISTSIDRISKRSLNIQSNPYLATSSGNVFLPYYIIDQYGDVQWYIGPPQLNGYNTLPYLAFFQNFDSAIFNQYAGITLYAALGQSNGDINDDFRTWSISFNELFSGQNNNHYTYNITNGIPQVNFQTTIPSSSGSGDSIFAQVFGMGNFFSGLYNVTATFEQNAGYFYTGYLFSGQNGIIDINYNYIIDNYNILGSQIQSFNYINGYTGINNFNISNMYCQDSTGELYQYYYFNNLLIQQNEWISGFAQLPVISGNNIDGQTGYGRVYNTSTVENSLVPRFSNGPYAITNKKFLYPNASGVSISYNSQINGFPSKVNFTLEVREETLKEIYGNYSISNGIFNPNINYVNIIRPQTFGYNLGVLKNIFGGPQGNILYDFNVWSANYGFDAYTGTNLINNLWAYYYEQNLGLYVIPSGRNNTIYNNEDIFNQGILYTGYNDFQFWTYTGYDPIDNEGLGFNTYARLDPGFGLYHNYTGYTITGQLLYTKPIYDLHSGMLNPYYSLNIMPLMACTPNVPYGTYGSLNPFSETDCIGTLGDQVFYMNGLTSMSVSGQDPIFNEFIGGRIGSYLAQLQGGYHSQGIIGDEWLSLYYNVIGSTNYFYDTCQVYVPLRQTNLDNTILLISSTPNGTKIYTRALNFNPMALNYNIQQSFYSGYNINSSINIKTIFDPIYNGIGFDLNNIFPLKYNDIPNYYNPSGLTIGPFDRDIEFYSYIPITGFTQLIINGDVLTDYYGCEYGCSNEILSSVGAGQQSKYNLNPYNVSINNPVDPFKIIPSGTLININIYSNAECSAANGDFYQTGIGVLSGSYIYIRARKALKECNVDTNLQNSNSWDNFQFEKDGMEQEFFISNTTFESLNGITNTFITFSRTGILYPQVNPNLLTGMGTSDKWGNLTLPTIQQYWKNISLKSGTTIYASGWREGSRISFTFKNVNVEYDNIPYASQNIIIPSGSVTITGSMYYLSQADASIFSEGIELSDGSLNLNLVTGFWAPYYVSEILNTIPFYNQITDTLNSRPILLAPSQQIQRQYIPLIIANETYNLLNTESPYFYNLFYWPSYSDLFVLNPNETIESLPVPDNITFLGSQMTHSASLGQKLSDGTNNPNLSKIYNVTNQYARYDSLSTNASYNTGTFIVKTRGNQVQLKQNENLPSGYLVDQLTSIYMIENGLV